MTRGSWQPLDSERGVWWYEYKFNPSGGKANACAIKLRDGELAVLSPPVGQAGIDQLKEHGEVVALVAPNGFHWLGQPEWQAAFPSARVFASEAAGKRIAKKSPETKRCEPLADIAAMLPDDVWIGEPPDMKHGDAVARVDVEGGAVWYFNDIVMNMPDLDGLPLPLRLLFKWTKSGPGFSVARLPAMFMGGKKPSVKRFMIDEMAKHPPVRVITGHGAPIDDATVAGELPQMFEAAF